MEEPRRRSRRPLPNDLNPPPGPALLAAAVIQQAVRDVRHGNALHRASAVRFLTNEHGALTAWCNIGGARVDRILTASRRLLKLGSST